MKIEDDLRADTALRGLREREVLVYEGTYAVLASAHHHSWLHLMVVPCLDETLVAPTVLMNWFVLSGASELRAGDLCAGWRCCERAVRVHGGAG